MTKCMSSESNDRDLALSLAYKWEGSKSQLKGTVDTSGASQVSAFCLPVGGRAASRRETFEGKHPSHTEETATLRNSSFSSSPF